MSEENRAPSEQPAAPASETPVTPAATTAPKRWTRFITPALAIVAALVVGGVAGVFIGQGTAQASNRPSSAQGFRGGQFGEGLPGGTGTGGTGGGFANGAGAFTAGTIARCAGRTKSASRSKPGRLSARAITGPRPAASK